MPYGSPLALMHVLQPTERRHDTTCWGHRKIHAAREQQRGQIQTVGALHTPPSSPASPRAFAHGVAPAALFASEPRRKNDDRREREDHGAPDAYCASPDGTVQPGTAQPDMPSPWSSTPPSDELRRSFQLDARSETAPPQSSDDQDAWLDTSEGSEGSVCSVPGSPRASLQTRMDRLRHEVEMRMSYPNELIGAFRREHHGMHQALQAQIAETQHLRDAVAVLNQKYDTLRQACDLLQASQPNGWQITTAPAGAPEIASPVDLGPATGAAPSGQPTNKTTAPVRALETTSELGPTATAMARHSKPAQGPNFTRDQPPSSGRSSDTGMAAGAPADGFVKQLPALSTQTSGGSLTTEPSLAAAADHGEHNTQPNPGSSPATPVSPPAGGAAPAARATRPEKSKKSKKSKKSAKKQRGARRPPGPAAGADDSPEEDPIMTVLGVLADAAADAAALDAASEDSDLASDGEG